MQLLVLLVWCSCLTQSFCLPARAGNGIKRQYSSHQYQQLKTRRRKFYRYRAPLARPLSRPPRYSPQPRAASAPPPPSYPLSSFNTVSGWADADAMAAVAAVAAVAVAVAVAMAMAVDVVVVVAVAVAMAFAVAMAMAMAMAVAVVVGGVTADPTFCCLYSSVKPSV
jgi:hypothetical protein